MSEAAPRFADLLASLAAIGRSIQQKFDPRRFLDEFSEQVKHLVPHDRLVIHYLDAEGQTFTVFAEAGLPSLLLHRAHYTTDFDPSGRYVVAEWGTRPVYSGDAIRADDVRTDPRFEAPSPVERRLVDAGLRSVLAVPLWSGGRVVGALIATSLTPGVYTDPHLAVARQVADLIAPFIENVVLLEQERRRRRRLRALQGLTHAAGASLDVRDVFDRLADAVRSVLDFDVMGVSVLSTSGRDVEIVAEVAGVPKRETPVRIPLDHFSFSPKLEAGEPVLIQDTRLELDPSRGGDRMIIEGGGRSCLSVPLRFGETVGGVLYFGKGQPYWFDRLDVEIAIGVAAQVVLALQHQRLAEEQRRVALVEGRARQLEERLESLRNELGERYGLDRLLGQAPSFRDALAQAARVAPTDTTVLITGESGTGKELVARAVHHASLRADGAFVAVNCAALPEALLESELFGHERGAFTGADRQKPGRFELAAGGTLFLDEVSELSPTVQAKLLRVLQEREFQRVGGTVTLRADVRLIAATNRDLGHAVETGNFREDVYYRLNVFPIHLPPLRERGDDVLLLAEHFLRTLGERMGRGEPGLSRDARETLLAHPWPGNIRELSNAIERALIVSDDSLLTAAHLGLTSSGKGVAVAAPDDGSGPSQPAQPRSLPEWEREIVQGAVEKAKGNKSRAARLLGLTRSQLYTRLKRFGLNW